MTIIDDCFDPFLDESGLLIAVAWQKKARYFSPENSSPFTLAVFPRLLISPTLTATSVAPPAVSAALRPISALALACSSTAAAG